MATTKPVSQSAPGYEIDEAFGAACRRYDKSVAMENLVRSYLTWATFMPTQS
jgi:hypothetical protein